MQSIRELFRIGNGPSSSHTLAPRRAADLFRQQQPNAAAYRVTLYGSLAATGKGHMTDKAIMEALSPAAVEFIWLPDEALPYAALLGRAFQYINFVRDIREDLELGRTYIPTEDLAEFNVPGLTLSKATEWPDIFSELVRKQLQRYRQWKREAEEGFRFIPARYLIAIKTAADIFDMTAAEIERNPAVVLRKKVKPSKHRVMTAGLRNLVGIGRRA